MSSTSLKDARGQTIGRIQQMGNQLVIYDRAGQRLGHYQESMNTTYDKRGQRFGSGNLLTMLLN
jgi:hypothetical protein